MPLDRCGGIFPRGQQAGARVRKRRREGNEWTARVERRYTIQRTIRWLSRTAVRWAHNSLRVPRPDPPLLPSLIFPSIFGASKGIAPFLFRFLQDPSPRRTRIPPEDR